MLDSENDWNKDGPASIRCVETVVNTLSPPALRTRYQRVLICSLSGWE